MGLVVPLRDKHRSYNESGAFNALVNVHGFADQEAFWTKSGSVGVVIEHRGVDPECLEPERIDSITALLDSAQKAFDERFILRQYLLKRSRPEFSVGTFKNEVVDRAIRSRGEYLSKKGAHLFSFETYLVVECKPESANPHLTKRLAHFAMNPRKVLRESLSVRDRTLMLDEDLGRSLRKLRHAVNSFLEQSGDCVSARILKKDEVFLFLRRLLNPNPAKASAVRLVSDLNVDYQAVDSELECHRDHLRLDNDFIKLLTLKQVPAHTFAHMLRDLYRVQADFVAISEWNVWDMNRAMADIRSRRRHWHNTKLSIFSQLGSERPSERELLFDDSKEALVGDLGQCLQGMEMEGVRIGNFTLTVMLIAEALEAADRASAEVMKVFGAHEGALNEERYNGLNAFLATLPGGYPFNLRKLLVTNKNQADMSFWFLPSEGERRNPFTGGEHLMAFETEDGSLFYFNLHVQDVAHTLVLGRTGSGKSFLLNVLATYAQKERPYTFIFDIGGSYRWLTELFGGSYVQIRPDRMPFSINPFVLDPTPRNLDFLFAFIKLLAESGGHRMSDAEERDLFEAIRSIYILDPDQRRLLTLSTTVRKSIGDCLKRWTEGEQFGAYFDNVKDTVTFSHFQCVDFEGMERAGVVLEAILFYLLHRANDIIYDESLATTFKLFIVDEAWRFFKHQTTRAYIIEALKTWRKKNAAMILATQSIQDLDGDVLRPVADACPTKLLLANPGLDATVYGDVLGLTATEQDRVRHLTPKRQFLLKRDHLSKVLNLNVDPESYWLFTTNPYEAKRRQEAIERFGLKKALETLKGESV